MLQIEWKSSHYHSNGRRRSRPKASTVHGWLVKWRATFTGNERLRKEGIREMREAKAVRKWKKQRKAARRAKAGPSKSSFCLWPILLGKREQRPRSSSRRPSHASSRRPAPPTRSPKPTPINSRQSTRNRQRAGNHSSRKASYSDRGDIIRAAKKKR